MNEPAKPAKLAAVTAERRAEIFAEVEERVKRKAKTGESFRAIAKDITHRWGVMISIETVRGQAAAMGVVSMSKSERMKRRHKDPAFAAANSERMKRRHQDPAFAAAHSERMKRMHEDPEYKRKLAEGHLRAKLKRRGASRDNG